MASGDVIFGESGPVSLKRWSKTLQNRKDFVTVSLPDLDGSHLCPNLALKVMFHRFSGTKNSPVFVIPRSKGLVPLNISRNMCLEKCQHFMISVGQMLPELLAMEFHWDI